MKTIFALCTIMILLGCSENRNPISPLNSQQISASKILKSVTKYQIKDTVSYFDTTTNSYKDSTIDTVFAVWYFDSTGRLANIVPLPNIPPPYLVPEYFKKHDTTYFRSDTLVSDTSGILCYDTYIFPDSSAIVRTVKEHATGLVSLSTTTNKYLYDIYGTITKQYWHFEIETTKKDSVFLYRPLYW